MSDFDYINGFVERKHDGKYDGSITIDGVCLDAIEGVYFKENGKNYLWLKRKPIMEYDMETGGYRTRPRKPTWEAYLEKQIDKDVVAYKGVFTFLRWRYSIVGVWDKILGVDKQRLNLFVERLPMNEQTILKKVNERKMNNEQK